MFEFQAFQMRKIGSRPQMKERQSTVRANEGRNRAPGPDSAILAVPKQRHFFRKYNLHIPSAPGLFFGRWRFVWRMREGLPGVGAKITACQAKFPAVSPLFLNRYISKFQGYYTERAVLRVERAHAPALLPAHALPGV